MMDEMDKLGFFEWRRTSSAFYKFHDPKYGGLPNDSLVVTHYNAHIFRFFRDMMKCRHSITMDNVCVIDYIPKAQYFKKNPKHEQITIGPYKTYEDAERNCIIKLIEITKDETEE